jgi:hypothetical protein
LDESCPEEDWAVKEGCERFLFKSLLSALRLPPPPPPTVVTADDDVPGAAAAPPEQDEDEGAALKGGREEVKAEAPPEPAAGQDKRNSGGLCVNIEILISTMSAGPFVYCLLQKQKDEF